MSPDVDWRMTPVDENSACKPLIYMNLIINTGVRLAKMNLEDYRTLDPLLPISKQF